MAEMIITKIFKFDSSHRLPNYNGPCSRLHGHSFILHVSVLGDVGKDGFVIDFKKLKEIVNKKVISKLDHFNLNDIVKNPTAENMCIWIWEQLKNSLNLHELILYESPDSFVKYGGK